MVEKVPVASREGLADGTGNMQSVYDRATCCQSTFFPPLFPHPSRYGDAAKLGRKYGWLATRDINVQKLESQFTPHTLPEFSSGSSLLSLTLSLLRRYSTTEKASPGIPRAFRINKGSEARRMRRRSSMKKLVPRDVSERRVLRKMLRKSVGELNNVNNVRIVEYIYMCVKRGVENCERFSFFFFEKDSRGERRGYARTMRFEKTGVTIEIKKPRLFVALSFLAGSAYKNAISL